MMRIGLTGGIASGKSTVSRMFQSFGIPVVDADVAARKVVEPGAEAYEPIIARFGTDILREDGTIDRKKLGALVFADEEKRLALNAIVHPAVRKVMLSEVEECARRGEKAVVLDIPLLFESRLTDWVDKIIVVYVPYRLQLERLMARNQFTKNEAELRIQAQMPLEEKKERADAVIDNSGTVAETRRQLQRLLQEWQLI